MAAIKPAHHVFVVVLLLAAGGAQAETAHEPGGGWGARNSTLVASGAGISTHHADTAVLGDEEAVATSEPGRQHERFTVSLGDSLSRRRLEEMPGTEQVEQQEQEEEDDKKIARGLPAADGAASISHYKFTRMESALVACNGDTRIIKPNFTFGPMRSFLAVCEPAMSAGQHEIEFSIECRKFFGSVKVGVCSAERLSEAKPKWSEGTGFLIELGKCGSLDTGPDSKKAPGGEDYGKEDQQGGKVFNEVELDDGFKDKFAEMQFSVGDTIRMRIDFDSGTLAVLGSVAPGSAIPGSVLVAIKSGLRGPLCWAVSVQSVSECVQIRSDANNTVELGVQVHQHQQHQQQQQQQQQQSLPIREMSLDTSFMARHSYQPIITQPAPATGVSLSASLARTTEQQSHADSNVVSAPLSLSTALESARLAKYEDAFRELGCEIVADLADLEDQDLLQVGLKRIEVTRLRRLASTVAS